jgi:hypothetical protein
MHSLSKILVRGLAAFALLAPAAFIGAAPVAATHTIATTTTCQNNYLTKVAGLGIICETTVVNSITKTGGSAVVTVHECNGPAGAATTCTTTTQHVASPVTAIQQCNGSINGGGTTFKCTVVVTNNFYGVSPGAAGVTVNECVGSGGGGGTAMTCTPLSATTSAAITQCNGSSSGGGGSMTCTATGMMAAAFAVTINQCNGSANGGGDAVVCSAAMTNNALPSATPTGKSPAPTNTVDTGSTSNSNPLLPLMLLVALGGFALAAVVTTKRRGVRI